MVLFLARENKTRLGHTVCAFSDDSVIIIESLTCILLCDRTCATCIPFRGRDQQCSRPKSRVNLLRTYKYTRFNSVRFVIPRTFTAREPDMIYLCTRRRVFEKKVGSAVRVYNRYDRREVICSKITTTNHKSRPIDDFNLHLLKIT